MYTVTFSNEELEEMKANDAVVIVENLTNYRPVAVTCNSYAECKDCKIGGFCGGGCQLSHQIDFKKCCTYEEEVFSHFMKTLFIPYIKSKYNEVNQNERKAENRCT